MEKLVFVACCFGAVAIAGANTHAQTQQVRVEIQSNAPQGGVALTPLWVGFHNGSFDSYNGGLSAEEGLERIAEDGNASVLSNDFLAGRTYVQNGVGGVFDTAQTLDASMACWRQPHHWHRRRSSQVNHRAPFSVLMRATISSFLTLQ